MGVWCHFSNLGTDLRTAFIAVSILDVLQSCQENHSIHFKGFVHFFPYFFGYIANNSNGQPNSCIVQKQSNTSTYPVTNVSAAI